jgi:type IV secretory pathway VirJ component
MKKWLTIFNLLIITMSAFAQSAALPVKEWKATKELPYIFYISGDGGLNSFSTSLCAQFANNGYGVTVLNAKSYFWNRKTPQQTAADIAIYMANQLSKQKTKQWILLGYSFGADVSPFIINNLPATLKNLLVTSILLSPSTSTDFEIHLFDMAGGSKKRRMDVLSEINKISSLRVVGIFSSSEKNFPISTLHLKNQKTEILPGGHHFEGNTAEVAQTIMKYFK